MFLVISGCLALIGIVFSTNSAHLLAFDSLSPLAFLAAAIRKSRRPENNDVAASHSRFSSDHQRESGIVDQQRRARERAKADGKRIAFEYKDEAVSGTKLHRNGLDQMLAAAEAGEFSVLYFFSLSRLARESIITMPLLKKLVYRYNVRFVSITEGLDSAKDDWELIATILALHHERYIHDLSANVFRGQEGALLAGFSVGDYCFGYGSVPAPGQENLRRGQKPQMVYVVNEEKSIWVERSFYWFVMECRSLRWIARELNRRGAPKDHRSTTPHWHHSTVATLLKNEKYIGIWRWGRHRNERDPETGTIFVEERAEEDVEKWTRHFPHLQLVPNEWFRKAGERLAENCERNGSARRTNGKIAQGASLHSDSRHLLSGLIVCGECSSRLHVGGSHGQYLFCPNHALGVCSCKTQLRRERAERMILDVLGTRVLNDSAWKQKAFEFLSSSWVDRDTHLPSELATAQKQLAEVDATIKRLVDLIEQGADVPEIVQRLRERRTERRRLVETVECLSRELADARPAPTEAWLDQQLSQLGTRLGGSDPAAARALKQLVGGAVTVEEIKRDGRKRHYLRGRFHVSTGSIAKSLDRSAQVPARDIESTEEIVIDFVEPQEIDARADRAKELYDQQRMHAEIAEKLKCKRSYVTKLLRHWFESHGLEMPDGRARRADLQKKHLKPPPHEIIAGDVMRLLGTGMLLQDIATELGCDRNTITKAVKFGHESRGLPVPDGRTRRKELDQKTSLRRSSDDAA